MSATAPARRQAVVRYLEWLDDDRVTRLYLATALFLVACFIVLTPGWLMDTRTLDSAAPLTKPQKFNVSLALHFLTLAVLSQLLPRNVRTGWAMLVAAYLACGSLVFETVYVTAQAARAQRSHFNRDTPAQELLYAAMGIGAVLMIVAALVLAWQIWRKGDRGGAGLRLGAIVGLSAGFVLTLVLAGYMSSTGRYVGAELTGGGATVPFFGWSREYGDLRPAHFVSMHLMQVVPFAGWLADRRGWRPGPVVLGVAAAQGTLAIALFLQALAGRPFWPA